MFHAPAVSSQPSSPSVTSPSSATASHKVGHQRRPSGLTLTEADEGLRGVLNLEPQSVALNAKTVFHSVCPVSLAKRSAVEQVDQHILRSCQEFISHTPQPQSSPSSHVFQLQQPPLAPLPYSSPATTTANHTIGRFFTPGSFFSPPCTRVGLGTPSSGGGIDTGSSPALKRTQFSAESNHSPHRPNPERQCILSNTNGTSLFPQLHPYQSSDSNGPGHGGTSHRAAAAPAPSMFRPILNIMAATSAALKTVESNNGSAVVGLSPSWSNEDLPSPIYNHGSNDSLYRHGVAPPGAVFSNRSASTSSESMTDVATTLTANRQESDDGGGGDRGGPQPPLEIRIQSPGLSLSSFAVTGSSLGEMHLAVDNTTLKDSQDDSGTDVEKDNYKEYNIYKDKYNEYLASTPLLDLQEQGYVVIGNVGLRDFEKEMATTLPELVVVDTTVAREDNLPLQQEQTEDGSDGDGDDSSLTTRAVDLGSSGGASSLSEGLDERYWLPTMSIEDLGSIQQELVEKTDELQPVEEPTESFSEPEIKPTEDQEREETQSGDKYPLNAEELILFSDLLPIALKEMEHQLMQEQESTQSANEEEDDDDDVVIIHIDFERLLQLCTEYEREKDEWRQLWARGGGLGLDLTFDDCELDTVKSLQQQQAEEQEILRRSCIIDMEGLLGCSWQQLQDLEKEMEMEMEQLCDELPCIEDEALLQEEHLEKEEEEEEEEEEVEAKVEGDANDPICGPMPLSKRVQFDPMIQVIEVEDSSKADMAATEEDIPRCTESAASPSPEWVAFRVFRPEQFTELSDLELSDLTSLSTFPEACAMSDPDTEATPIQESTRHTLSIATATNDPALPPSPLLHSGDSQTENNGPISASSEFSESSTSTLTSPTDTNCDTCISAEKEAEVSFSTTVVTTINTSLGANVLSPLSQTEEDGATLSPASPRTLELKATRMQLQYWVETAARLRDREVILTDKIDELVQDMSSIFEIYQDAELGRQATEMVVQELKQELVKEQEIGFASIQEAALSIQEKQVLESALAVSWAELQLLREAWSSQKAPAMVEQHTSDKDAEEAEEVEETEALINEPEPITGLEVLPPPPSQKSAVPTFLKQACLVLIFVFAATTLLVLLCGHQHQLHASVLTFKSSVSNWSQLATNHISLELSELVRVWQPFTDDNLSDAAPVLSSMKKWQRCLQQSGQVTWVLEHGSNWANGQIQHWTLVFETLMGLWMDLTPTDVWRGYRLGLLRS